jgi:hypothetical protein
MIVRKRPWLITEDKRRPEDSTDPDSLEIDFAGVRVAPFVIRFEPQGGSFMHLRPVP